MKVIIAEKPSVAREIAQIVGAHSKQKGYIEGNGYAVTWALGHLVSLSMPEAYGANGFNREHLPIIPEPFRLTVRQEKSDKGYKDSPAALKQLKVIKQLFGSCDSIIVATDAGREGELIFRYIYSYLKCNKPFVRLWISSLTEKAIREGLANLKDGTMYDNLYLSAKARSEADWLIGINATQALTIAAGEGTYSLGRVQTPTLMMICSRYLDNKNFVSTPFWHVMATMQKNGISVTLETKDSYTDKQKAEQVSWELMDTGSVIIEAIDKKEVSEQAPLLFDLTSLQKEMNSKHSLTAQETLSIAQELYEAKYITYPRTDSKYVSEDVYEDFILPFLHSYNAVDKVKGYEELFNPTINKHCIDGSKINDHHAIIITENTPQKLTEIQSIVYEAIKTRLAIAFMEPCRKTVKTITAKCGDIVLKASSTHILRNGWKGAFALSDESKEFEYVKFPDLSNGETVPVVEGGVIEKRTKSKPIHTEATLLAAMETAGKELENEEERMAMKESGIGTPATRAAIIETLFVRDYMCREKNRRQTECNRASSNCRGAKEEGEAKSLVPTPKGMAVYGVVKDKRIADVQMTGMWEAALANIEKGEMNSDTFGQGIRVLTGQITTELLGSSIEHDGGNNLVCPKCGAKKVLIYDKVAKCRNVDCSLTIFRNKCGKQLTEKHIADLLSNRKTGLIKGFKSKEGKSFDASLVLDDSFAVQLQFPERKK